MKKLADRLKEHKDIEVPYHVWTCFGNQSKEVLLSGNQASFGEDYKSLEELRNAIEWYVEQLDGKVKWNK